VNIHQEVFDKHTLLPERLKAFGFVPKGRDLIYSQEIMDGQMRVEIKVDGAGNATSTVIDAATDEPYAPVNVEWSQGAFVGAVREAYRAVLVRVAEACCRREYFSAPQSNRIADLVLRRYGEAPDFPFATAPTYGVFRYPQNRKWYGLVMDVKRFRITKEPTTDCNEAPMVDVLNLKIDPARKEALLAIDGIWPCYHMNRDSWISIVLDDTVADELIMELLDASRQFAINHKK